MNTNARLSPLSSLLAEKSRNGLSARPTDTPPGYRILRISAGTSQRDGIVDETDCKFLDISEAQAVPYILRSRDLLACRFNGNLHYVGRFSIFEGLSDGPRLHPDKLIRFRIDESKACPYFVRLAMNSTIARKQIESFCQTTAGNIGVSAKNLNTVEVPLPELTEQRSIVSAVDRIRALTNTGLRNHCSAGDCLAAVMPSVLDRAFRGEL